VEHARQFRGCGLGSEEDTQQTEETQYVVSVYEAWMSLDGATVEQWYERYVVQDQSDRSKDAQRRTSTFSNVARSAISPA
jgi:hypothetical protein